MAAHLVFNAAGRDAVEVAHRAVRVLLLRHEEQGDALGARRCARQAREYAMHDVLGHVVLAARDKNLGAVNLVAAVAIGLSVRRHLPEVRAALGLRQAHGARELTGDERREPLFLQLVCRVGDDRVDRALGEAGEHGERPVRRRRHLRLDQCHRHGQALTAPLFGVSEALPAALAKELVRLLVALRRLDGRAVDPRAAFAVAVGPNRRELVLAQRLRRVDDHVDCLAVRGSRVLERRVVLVELVDIVDEEPHVARGYLIPARHHARGHGARMPRGALQPARPHGEETFLDDETANRIKTESLSRRLMTMTAIALGSRSRSFALSARRTTTGRVETHRGGRRHLTTSILFLKSTWTARACPRPLYYVQTCTLRPASTRPFGTRSTRASGVPASRHVASQGPTTCTDPGWPYWGRAR